ncbi:MAG: cell division protein ZapA [Clostridia bacterium]|nr:cell division protein ZapA [Clostridia bacterium]
MASKNKVDIRIAGKDYTLVGTESDEYIQKVGLYIDKKMNEIMRNNSRLSTSMAAVLTAINIADDYFKAYQNEKSLREELQLIYEKLESLKAENKSLSEQNDILNSKGTHLQLELAKREAELNEVRNSVGKTAVGHRNNRFRA